MGRYGSGTSLVQLWPEVLGKKVKIGQGNWPGIRPAGTGEWTLR